MRRILITGGHGFIGSHVAKALYESGTYELIRIVDIQPKPTIFHSTTICHEEIIGDLANPYTLNASLNTIDTVIHFAANMGGMGTIHSSNDFPIYSTNHGITLKLLSACTAAGSTVHRVLYASSACVYPEHLQQDPTRDFKLGEDDAFAGASAQVPPRPQGLYGLEKLNTELVLNQLAGTGIQVQIARFHNVYGPGGVYDGGREKVPAAFLRKAIALSHLIDIDSHHGSNTKRAMEVWGDGSQRRSFLYIDDAVDAVLHLLNSGYCEAPLNIGSEDSVSIDDLARLALDASGVPRQAIELRHFQDKPVGVGSRCSDNALVTMVLGWTPRTSLQDGMKHTHAWIADEIACEMNAQEDTTQYLEGLGDSKLLDMASDTISFAVLLPITSRHTTAPPSQCIDNLKKFAESLKATTVGDIVLSQPEKGGTQKFSIKIYVAIDDDDEYLLHEVPPEAVLRSLGFSSVTTLTCRHPRGHVCALWRDCARQAWRDGCNYYALFGDDVTLIDEGWMRSVHSQFVRFSAEKGLPFGVGCVALTDVSFPGMPTFPIIHRRHMDAFEGEVVPEVFVNQDGDPFLFQLYRRFGCSVMISSRVSNSIGGSDDARYLKQHAKDWTFEVLDSATHRVANFPRPIPPTFERPISLDIVIPCYRVQLSLLSNILELKAPPGLAVMFIIIVDNPSSNDVAHLKKLFQSRVDVRIRVNKSNLGASASRNRGMVKESAAEWVHFLDDDIVPDPELLFEDEKIIRAYPNAAGFVGNCQFPVASTVFQAAVHLASITYFWDIAKKIPTDVPWGVTANLIARRNKDGVAFDLRYPKTGGGEDIDFCVLKKRAAVEERGREGVFVAAPDVVVTHPWWNEGQRSYWRFYKWAHGDGGLVARFPEHTYFDYAPNSAELVGASVVIAAIGLPLTSGLRVASLGLAFRLILAVLVVNVTHDLYRHFWRHPERDASLNLAIKGGPAFYVALVESSLIRMFSELGRMKGILDRGEWGSLGRRFDWFVGRYGDGPRREERVNSLERFVLILLFVSMTYVL